MRTHLFPALSSSPCQTRRRNRLCVYEPIIFAAICLYPKNGQRKIDLLPLLILPYLFTFLSPFTNFIPLFRWMPPSRCWEEVTQNEFQGDESRPVGRSLTVTIYMPTAIDSIRYLYIPLVIVLIATQQPCRPVWAWQPRPSPSPFFQSPLFSLENFNFRFSFLNKTTKTKNQWFPSFSTLSFAHLHVLFSSSTFCPSHSHYTSPRNASKKPLFSPFLFSSTKKLHSCYF